MIVDYLTGELEPEITLKFDKHLQLCPDCVAFLNTYKKTIQVAQSFLSKDIPSKSLTQVRLSINQKMERPRGR